MAMIPKQVEYALMALAEMHAAEEKPLHSVRELCDSNKVAFDLMAKAMQRMAKAGILHTVQGVHGGYSMAAPLDRLSLLELIEAVNGPVTVVNCLNDSKACSLQPTCKLIDPMIELDRRMHEFYAGVCVLDLISTEGACGCGEAKKAVAT